MEEEERQGRWKARRREPEEAGNPGEAEREPAGSGSAASSQVSAQARFQP